MSEESDERSTPFGRVGRRWAAGPNSERSGSGGLERETGVEPARSPRETSPPLFVLRVGSIERQSRLANRRVMGRTVLPPDSMARLTKQSFDSSDPFEQATFTSTSSR